MTDEPYSFILFISGMSVKSSRAVENLKRICDAKLAGNFKLQIVDISQEKAMAKKYEVFAIPTLLKVSPLPMRTILGDLSDEEKVLKILELN